MQIARRSEVAFVCVVALLAGTAVGVVGGAAFGAPWAGTVVAALVFGSAARKPLRRWRLSRQTFPAPWRDWLDKHVAVYRHADAEARARFERDVQFVLAEHPFEAVKGVELTDELRLSVAAGAALLLHGRPERELPSGRAFVFYPGRFDREYEVDEGDFEGMVHHQGPVLFSAPAVERSWARADGYNVVLHELAHLFDFEAATGAGADGVPSLLAPASTGAWLALVRREMREAAGGRSVLSRYAATAPAELFAVAVEQFFERPGRLHRHHPELYAALAQFFQLDPRAFEEDDEPPADVLSLMARRWLPPEDEAGAGATSASPAPSPSR